jgi:prepilin-type N-terminal cleavage/methylation domain-containing protein
MAPFVGNKRGMTLIELLMVMGLLALMLGVGVGVVASLDIGTYGASSLVRSSLRSANQWAMARQAPARVRIDPGTGRVAAEGLAVVGTWQFESVPPKGALGLDGELIGAELVEDGFVGRALSLAGAARGGSYVVPVHTDPAFAFEGGFQVQVALRPEEPRRGRVLMLDRSLKLEITQRLGIVATVGTQRYDEENGREVGAGNAVLSTPDEVLELGRWSRVLVSYDRSRLAILVEGVEVASLAEEGAVLPVKAAMTLGGGDRPWGGSVDSLVISAVGATEEVFLPLGVSFPKDTIREVAFAAGGGLDRTVHDEPVLIRVEYEDGRSEELRVNMYGTVE